MLDLVMKNVSAILLASLIPLAACGGAAAPEVDATKGQIRVDLKEFAIPLTSTTMRAGTVTFVTRNVGGAPHSLVVIKTDAPPDKLPLDPQKQIVKEDGKVGGLDPLDPGKSGNLRLELPAGTYVLVCNVPTHYQLGMRSVLTVR